MDINRLEIDKFIKRTQDTYKRLAYLYNHINSESVVADRLPQALLELGSASEIIDLATQELHQQNEELIKTRSLLEAERQRYQNLFEFAPDAYVVTDSLGIIQEANRTAAKLFNYSQQSLVGKPIINFVTLKDRQTFRGFLIQLKESNKIKELVVSMQKRGTEQFDAAMTVGVVCEQQSQPTALRWLIRDITEHKQVESSLLKDDCALSQDRPLHQYCKGETILLNPGIIWYVHQGWVKLTTLCETGEEVLVGLAGEGTVFGASLTALHIYQATALSNVSVVSINEVEIVAFPMLSHILLPKINQRLQQTESFLAICGRRRVQDRFHQLLILLKQEIGEPVAQGTRFLVRLTHEDLASACCTTRVTITRLLGSLQRQGKIAFDSNNHIILKNIS